MAATPPARQFKPGISHWKSNVLTTTPHPGCVVCPCGMWQTLQQSHYHNHNETNLRTTSAAWVTQGKPSRLYQTCSRSLGARFKGHVHRAPPPGDVLPPCSLLRQGEDLTLLLYSFLSQLLSLYFTLPWPCHDYSDALCVTLCEQSPQL